MAHQFYIYAITRYTSRKHVKNGVRMHPCPFCNTQALEERIIYTTDIMYVLVPSKPASLKHLLIIPKAHRPTYLDLTLLEIGELQQNVRLIVDKLSDKQSTTGYNLVSNNGTVQADQHVPHFHQHLFIRSLDEPSPFSVLNGTADAPRLSQTLAEHARALHIRLT